MHLAHFAILLIGFFGMPQAAAGPPETESGQVAQLIERNVASVGGKARMEEIHSYSFRVRQKTYTVSRDGRLKIMSGSDPVITEVIIADASGARRNCYNSQTDFEGLIKATYQAMARLNGGLFTTALFADRLQSAGTRKYGPVDYLLLTAREEELDIEFYLDPASHILKRVVMRGYRSERGHYQISYDFGPLQEIGGIRIPSSWFSSQVGSRGTLHEITDVVLNPDLPDDFFDDLRIRAGEVKIEEGALTGNILQFNANQPQRISLSTNWTRDCMRQAGFESGELLILELAGREIEVTFFDTPPSRQALAPGARLLVPNRRDENFLIYILRHDDPELVEQLQRLLEIRVRRK